MGDEGEEEEEEEEKKDGDDESSICYYHGILDMAYHRAVSFVCVSFYKSSSEKTDMRCKLESMMAFFPIWKLLTSPLLCGVTSLEFHQVDARADAYNDISIKSAALYVPMNNIQFGNECMLLSANSITV
jgi:hypothetical protein